jgi:hypothetical protein
MPTTLRAALAVLPFLLAVACTDAAKAPAEAALAAAGSAMEQLKGDAARYAPEAVKSAQRSYDAARDLVSRQDYKGALAAANEIPAQVKAALAAASARKDELVKAVNDVAADVPKTIADLKEKVATLARSKKLPRGVDRAAVEKAEQGVAALEAGWKKVSAQVKEGAYDAAIEATRALKAQAQEISRSIGG